jgi:phage terminase Nu1 subunit (DNA packaging protein)
MSLESITKLSELTGIDRRTCKKRLLTVTPIIKGSAHLYESTSALVMLYGNINGESNVFDLQQEQARLNHHKANKAELEADIIRGELIPTELVFDVQGNMVMNCRAKLLAIPTKAASMVHNMTNLGQIEAELKSHIYEALTELSEFNPSDYGITKPDSWYWARIEQRKQKP